MTENEERIPLRAVVYTSHAGHTREFARMAGEALGLPVYALKDAERRLPKGAGIVYMGWLMGGFVRGYASAAKRYRVAALCAVGMGAGDGQMADVRRQNKLPDTLRAFYLQGGYEAEKTHGIWKLMMSMAGRSKIGNAPTNEQEREMLDMLEHGRNLVSREQLDELMRYLRG